MSVKVNDNDIVKVMVHNWRNPPVGVPLECGSTIIQHQDFAYDPDIRGLKIIDTDKEDRDAYIQSFADDCGVYNVLKKYSKTGDLSLLEARQVFYGDMTTIPADNLDPAAASVAAAQAISGLNAALGSDITQEQLLSMSSEELNALISAAVSAAAAKQNESKEGE